MLHVAFVPSTGCPAQMIWTGDERPKVRWLKLYVVSIGWTETYFCPESTRWEYSTCQARIRSFRAWNEANARARDDEILEHRHIYADDIAHVRRAFPEALENRPTRADRKENHS